MDKWIIINIFPNNGVPIVEFHDGTTYRRMYYSRYIMSLHLQRELMIDEIVHHKDENPSNNDVSNLEIVTRAEHIRIHSAARIKRQKFICPECKKEFELSGDQLMRVVQRRKQIYYNGPFCSKSHSASYQNRGRYL